MADRRSMNISFINLNNFMHSWAPRKLGWSWKNFSDHFSHSPTSRAELSRQWVRKWGSRSCSFSAWFLTIRKRFSCTCAAWQIEFGSITKSMNYRTMRKVAAYLHRVSPSFGRTKTKVKQTEKRTENRNCLHLIKLMRKMETEERQVRDARRRKREEIGW